MNNYPNARDCEHGQLARACEICELQARLAECERENTALKEIPQTVYEAVERVLDEESAWIARPSPSVTRRVALSATIACSVAWNESFENAVRREQAMQGMRDYVSQLEDTCDTLRAQLAETQRLLEAQLAVGDKLTAEVAKLNERYDALARVSVVGVEWKMKAEKLEAELAALREACLLAVRELKAFDGDAEELGGQMAVAEKILRDALGR